MNNEIKPKKTQIVNKETLLVTVDIGKVTNMGYYRCPDRTEIKPFEFFNTGRGFSKFWQCISEASHRHALLDIVVGFESTGPYGEALVHYLRKREVKLVQVNPMHTKRLKELQGNSPNKTDKKDPKVIADIVELGHSLSLVVPEGVVAELRRLIHARERHVETRTRFSNQLEPLLATIFPEFLQIMKKVTTKSAQYLLKEYTTPQNIAKLGLEKLTTTLKKISRGKLGPKRAESLYNAARSSVGVMEGRKSMLLEITHILAMREAAEGFITEVEEEIGTYLQQIPYSKFILSLKGVAEITTAGLIGEVGDFRQFSSISEIHKLAGLDLFEISSGKHKGQRRISKRGRSLMRKILFFAALSVVRKGGILHEQYQKYLQRGMLKMKALIAIARKLLGIIFAMVRDHNSYDPDYLERKQEQQKQLAVAVA